MINTLLPLVGNINERETSITFHSKIQQGNCIDECTDMKDATAVFLSQSTKVAPLKMGASRRHDAPYTTLLHSHTFQILVHHRNARPLSTKNSFNLTAGMLDSKLQSNVFIQEVVNALLIPSIRGFTAFDSDAFSGTAVNIKALDNEGTFNGGKRALSSTGVLITVLTHETLSSYIASKVQYNSVHYVYNVDRCHYFIYIGKDK